MAGTAIRAGVDTTLGSLWAVNDEQNVNLITDFYSSLKESDLSLAEALRRAQLKQINQIQGHPGSWANLILIE